MKKTLAVILTLALTITLFSACAKNEPEVTTTEATVTEESTTKPTSQATTKAEETTTKKEAKEKSFDEWDETDLVKYFKAQKVFTDDDSLSVISKDEELPDGVNAEIDYDNHKNDEIYVLIYYLDADSKNKKTEEIYNQIKKDKCAKLEGTDGYQQPFNALVGRFAIFYSSSIDERFVDKFESALDKLIEDKGIKPVYYEKDLDLSKFNQDDDVVIIEGND